MNFQAIFNGMSLASKMEYKEPITAQDFLIIVQEFDTQIKILEFQLDKLRNMLSALKYYSIKELQKDENALV